MRRLYPDTKLLVEVTPRLLARQQRTPDEVTRLFTDAGLRVYRMINDYIARSYTDPAVAAPQPWNGPLRDMSGILFPCARQIR